MCARVAPVITGLVFDCRTLRRSLLFFFFNDTATTEIYTLSLHDALPIYPGRLRSARWHQFSLASFWNCRSEEHTSELQSHSFISYAVFCLKKNNHDARPSHLSRHRRGDRVRWVRALS